jgi:hypothetical protein
MSRIEMVSQSLLAEVLFCTGVMRTLPTAFIVLSVNVIIYVLSIVTRVFHLYKTTLYHAVWTPTRCRYNAFRSDTSIDDVRICKVLYYMSVPIYLTRKPDSTLDAEFGACWYRHLRKDAMFGKKMCVKVIQAACIMIAGTPLAAKRISGDVITHMACCHFHSVEDFGTAARSPQTSPLCFLQVLG